MVWTGTMLTAAVFTVDVDVDDINTNVFVKTSLAIEGHLSG